jgi:hypothetical protein
MSHLQISTTQLFSRKALDALLAQSGKLPREDEGRLLAIKRGRNKSGCGVDGEQTIQYNLSRKAAGTLGYGRIFGTKTSFEWLPSDYRGALCGEYYHDIDMVNAQPILLAQHARARGVDMPVLDAYIDAREEFLVKLGGTRNEAKEAVIAVLYGGRPTNPLLNALYNEVNGYSKLLSRDSVFADLWEVCKKEDRKYGSLLAHILQTEERTCMLAMKEVLEEEGWSVDVLVFDGVMIRKRTDATVTDGLLRLVESSVLHKTGYEIKLIEKPMAVMDLPDPETPAQQKYAAMKADFEADHFYYKPTGTVVETSAKGLGHFPLEHAFVAFNALQLGIGANGEPELFIKRWIKDKDRRTVTDLVYKLPEDCESHEASLFTGFAYQQLQSEPTAGAIELFTDLLRAVCGDEEDVYTYLLKTFAHIIQRPFNATGVCVIFSSLIQGTGKDTVMGILTRLVGRHTAHYTSDDDFWSPYDTKKEGSLVMYLEEAGSGANKAKFNALKARITTATLTVNPKGVRAYDVPNVARYFMTTNEADPVRLEESDRRFLMVNPSTRLVKSNWTSIYSQIEQPGFLVAVGKYLETIDLTGWNSRTFPVTEVKAALMELSKTSEASFLEEWASTSQPVEGGDLYTEYRSWCIEHTMPYAQSTMSFLKKALPLKGRYYTTTKGSGNKTLYHPISPVS